MKKHTYVDIQTPLYPHNTQLYNLYTAYLHTHTRDMMTLSMLKQNVYMALEPQRSEGEVGKEMEVLEARLNVMHTVFLVLQTSFSLGDDILLKGQQMFQTLANKHFTESLEVPMQGGLTPACMCMVVYNVSCGENIQK